MPTTVLDAYSKAYPTITNRIRASVFAQSDPQALVATIIEAAPHPVRIWHFPGLPRNNYGFSLDEINDSDLVVANLALFDVVPGQIDGQLVRDDEQIRVGETPGFDATLNTVTFDGTGGKPNYIGWEIVPSELTGRGILARLNDQDYTWDSVTGIFTLTQPGDQLSYGTYWNIHFNPIANPVGNSYPTINDFGISLITVGTVLDNTYFGHKLIVEPVANYIEVTLPPLAVIPQGRKLLVEIGGVGIKCVKFISSLGQPINFLRGTIYAYPGESFEIYKFMRDSIPEWRVDNACGNFRDVGRNVEEDFTQVDTINSKLLDGSIEDIFQYARIYNEVVLNLPPAQAVAFADWSTGNNKYFYSLANASNQFHFPDRRGLFSRNVLSGKAGDFAPESILINADVKGVKVTPGLVTAFSVDSVNPTGKEFNITEGFDIVTPGATETAPAHYLINRYVLI